MGMSERDPKRNPKVGDVLMALSGSERRVVSVQQYGRNTHLLIRFAYGDTGVSSTESIRDWRKWAKDAEVISRGE